MRTTFSRNSQDHHARFTQDSHRIHAGFTDTNGSSYDANYSSDDSSDDDLIQIAKAEQNLAAVKKDLAVAASKDRFWTFWQGGRGAATAELAAETQQIKSAVVAAEEKLAQYCTEFLY